MIIPKRSQRPVEPQTTALPRKTIKRATPVSTATLRQFWQPLEKPKAVVTRVADRLTLVPVSKATGNVRYRPLDGPDETVEKTFWLVDFVNDKISHLESVGAGGSKVGWDTCGNCKKHFYNCRCPALAIPKYIYRQPGQLAAEGSL